MYNTLFSLQEEIFKALAHSRRLEIIHLLRDQALTVSDIYTMLDLPQANVSQHLQILRDAQIVTAQKQGKQMVYTITDSRFLQMADLARELLVDKHSVGKTKVSFLETVPLTHDVVCGMRVSPKTAGFVLEHDNTKYYFCASGCLEVFKKNPSKFIK